jgi:predicted methyltransferase
MKRTTLTALAGVLALTAGGLAAWSSGAASAIPANIAAAVADPARTADDKTADANRKPAETLQFIGVKPGMKVVDFWPGGGYFSRLLSAAVGPKGKVYAFVPQEIAKFPKVVMPANGSNPDPARPNITAVVSPIMGFSTPERVDIVWTAQNYHDLHDPFAGPADMLAFDKAVYKSLKPGGYFVILDHSAPDGSGAASTNTTHRIDSALVKQEVLAAGFKFVGESNILRNPADPRTALVFDPAIRHHTDQFIYKFQKPK